MTVINLDLFGDDPRPRRGEYPMPQNVDAVACKSCGKPVVWTRTLNGNALPLSVATVEERGGQRFAVSHFADCPDAQEWRRR